MQKQQKLSLRNEPHARSMSRIVVWVSTDTVLLYPEKWVETKYSKAVTGNEHTRTQFDPLNANSPIPATDVLSRSGRKLMIVLCEHIAVGKGGKRTMKLKYSRTWPWSRTRYTCSGNSSPTDSNHYTRRPVKMQFCSPCSFKPVVWVRHQQLRLKCVYCGFLYRVVHSHLALDV